MTDCPCASKDLKSSCSPMYGFCKDGQRQIPVKLLDVAGLIPGASEGAGLGNKVDYLIGCNIIFSFWTICVMHTFLFM